jgi:2,5-dihydroxypyridine 5,6-dioxygenase
VSGTIVLEPGDQLFPLNYMVQSRITLTVEQSYIRAIEGTSDAALLKSYFEKWNDPEVYATSHMGWGAEFRADWHSWLYHDRAQFFGMEQRSLAGNFLFSTGPNTEFGGTRATPCHIDIATRYPNIFIDDVLVIDHERFLDASLDPRPAVGG